MANDAIKIERFNDELKIIFEDGTSQLALPSGGYLWYTTRKTIPVTPQAPARSGRTVTIPRVTGVSYLRDGNPVADGSAQYLTSGVPSTFTAVADPGYSLTAGDWEWTYTWSAPVVEDYRFPFPRRLIDFASYYGHSGIDWGGGKVGSSSPILAIGPGTVIGRTTNTANNPSDFSEPTWRGCSILLDHGTIDGREIWSLYAHMVSAPIVGMGDTVTGGQQLGTIGNSGASFGTHLHLEVIYNGDRLQTSTPGNNTPGLGFTRTLNWLEANTDGDSW